MVIMVKLESNLKIMWTKLQDIWYKHSYSIENWRIRTIVLRIYVASVRNGSTEYLGLLI